MLTRTQMMKNAKRSLAELDAARPGDPAVAGVRQAILAELERMKREERAELEAKLAWYESDEAMELFRTGRMMYPDVSVAVLQDRLARLNED